MFDKIVVGYDGSDQVREALAVREADSGKARSALGSVSHELLHEADRPVVVIPYKLAREHIGTGS